jgi:hypothetical protein
LNEGSQQLFVPFPFESRFLSNAIYRRVSHTELATFHLRSPTVPRSPIHSAPPPHRRLPSSCPRFRFGLEPLLGGQPPMEGIPLSSSLVSMNGSLAMDNRPQETLRLPSHVPLYTLYTGTWLALGTSSLCSSIDGRVVVRAGPVPTRLNTVHDEYHKTQQRGMEQTRPCSEPEADAHKRSSTLTDIRVEPR